MAKVLLINPRGTSPANTEYRVHPPIGLASIAAVLKQAGYSVALLDCAEHYKTYSIEEGYRRTGLPIKNTLKKIEQEKADIIGVSCNTKIDRTEVKKLTKAIKENFDAPIILGGHDASVSRREILGETEYEIEKIPSIDYVINGYGQPAIIALIEYILSGKAKNLNGISFQRNGKVVEIPAKTFNPDNYPIPAIELFSKVDVGRDKPFDIYSFINNTHLGKVGGIEDLPRGILYTSNGCPYHCIYCDSVDNYTYLSAKKVLEWIRQYDELFGIRSLDFTDENLTGNKPETRQRIFEIFQKIRHKKYKLAFSDGLTFESMTRNNFELLKKINKAGEWMEISLPIETTNDRLLKLIRKPHNKKMVEKTLYFIREHYPNVFREAFFIGGIVDENYKKAETPKELEEDYKFMKFCFEENLLDQINFFRFSPIPHRLYKKWRAKHPNKQFESLLFSQDSETWPHNNEILSEMEIRINELHKEHGKQRLRNY